MLDMNWFLDMIKHGHNPQQLMMNVLESRMKGTPMGNNLINLARQGNTAEIEKIARNLAAERGIDFDTEFNNFRRQFGM